MYIVTVTFEIAADHLEEFRTAMHQQAENSLQLEAACRQFDVCFCTDSPVHCFLYEKYDDKAAFQAHLESDHFKAFDALVGPWIVSKTVNTWNLSIN
ncbi:MAG: putative quinol monooxygenase [Lacipirellulaceae bacterium]